tara:strand:- start:5347 stop:6030 length:684 start_codon:yes stop_codon:yes gene_type:complete
MYTPGDLIQFDIGDQSFYGEVLGVDDDGKIEVSRLKQTTKQEGRIWEFVEDNKWSTIDTKYVKKHVKVTSSARRPQVVKAWKTLGFVPGGDGITFCRTSDENQTTLPMYEGAEDDSEDDEDELPSTNPNMHGYADDGFVVPDDEGSDFEFADPDELDEEAAKFVRETHQAVHDYQSWEPKDKQGRAIKGFIDRMDYKATIQTDNKRVERGKSSIPTSKPPLEKKRKR